MNRRYQSDARLSLFFGVCAMFGTCLFLYGFFPSKTNTGDFSSRNDIPVQVNNVRLNRDALYRRSIGRLVFVLIDAFRWDFVRLMPYTVSLIQTGHGSLLSARCHPPTATMPRVKALMTGTVPNYIDVLLNLGSQHVTEDNLLHQAVEEGLKTLFYGDETWLHLFPDKFLRSEGTTSFFVSDYTDVDLNVTRHIPSEMGAGDWDILVLHYLGLDHIGHLAGPTSSLVPPKLKEMDSVVQSLHKSLLEWDRYHADQPSLMVIVGDHGMHNSGSHGGATMEEVLVSLVLVGEGFSNSSEYLKEVSQVDVAATLAVLLGLPIPKSSLGSLIPQALGRLTQKQYLFALYYNALQVAERCITDCDSALFQDSNSKFLQAQRLHSEWLLDKAVSDKSFKEIEFLYIGATQHMSHTLVAALVKFDYLAMFTACVILIQILILVAVSNFGCLVSSFESSVTSLAITGFTLTVSGILLCSFSGQSSALCSSSLIFNPMSLVTITILSANIWFLKKFGSLISLSKIQFWMDKSLSSIFLYLGSLLHSISLGASSFIEEEHQTWYFLWVTFGLLVLCGVTRRRAEEGYLRKVTLVVSVLLSHRVLRKLNQTGDKWSSLPDLADWLEEPENNLFLLVLAVIGLMGTWMGMLWLHRIKCVLDGVLHCGALGCVLFYRARVGDVNLPFVFLPSRGVTEVRLFWIFWWILLSQGVLRLRNNFSIRELLSVCTSSWLLISSLLLHPHNIILIPSLLLNSVMIHTIFPATTECTLAHGWIGAVGFFYQGNSNSLATIDVAAGYVGAQEYSLFTTGTLVAVHTLAARVTALLLLWVELTRPGGKREVDVLSNSLRVTLLQRLLPFSVYCIITGLQSNHLFVWTVFAPKLLYESVLTLLICLTAVLGHLLIVNRN